MSSFNDRDLGRDIKKIIFHYLSYYRLFIFLVVILLSGVFFYNKTLMSIYSNTVSVHLVKDFSSFFTTDFSFETSLTSPQAGMRYGLGIEDEITLIKSYATVKKTLDQLEFEVTYYDKDTIFPKIPYFNRKVNEVELYGNLPVKIVYDASHAQAIYKDFSLKLLSDSTCLLSCSKDGGSLFNYIDHSYMGSLNGKKMESVIPINSVIENEFLRFQVRKTEFFNNWEVGEVIYFYFNDPDVLTMSYKGRLNLQQLSPSSFIINISLAGNNFAKVTAFLNAFSENVLNSDLERKNMLASSTIRFIDDQLGEISDSLQDAKSNLERFRSVNKITDLSFQGQRLFDQVATVENEKATLEMQERYYKYLIDYIKNKKDKKELVSPASMDVVDPLLAGMIQQLSTLYSQYNNYSESSATSIYLKDLKIKINNQESAILENASNNLKTIQLSTNELNYRLTKLNKMISELPKTELRLIDIERKFKLNDAVLTFLMQKRSEAQIAMASTKPSYEIVEPARGYGGGRIGPNKMLNYVIAVFLGLFIPFLYILISDFLDTKVRDRHGIRGVEKFPYLGSIHRNNQKSDLCIVDYPDSIISESFRSVRTNMQFMLDLSEARILSVSSSSSGEGKSFFASNIAVSYALSGYRTVLLEFDLRRPRVGKSFKVQSELGLTSYLSNNATLEDIMIPYDRIENLSLILAGSRAPNPANLISSVKTKELLEFLKSEYDIIVLDTAPVGIVSETYYLLSESDLSLFVVRQDFSNKELVEQTIEQLKGAKIRQVGLVINDVSGKAISKYQKSGYRKYYEGVSEPKGLAKIFSTKRRRS